MNKPAQLLTATLVCAFVLTSEAGVYRVTSTRDSTKASSLRGAIIRANHDIGYNVIYLTETNYVLDITGAFEDKSLTGDLDVTTGSLLIKALNPNTTIDATALGDRIFQVHKRARLTLRNIILTGGRTPDGAYGQWLHFDPDPGGAIHNSGITTLWNCSVVSNAVGVGGIYLGSEGGGQGGSGGGIFNGGKLGIYNCHIAGNTAGSAVVSSLGGDGGGIFNLGDCVIKDSWLVGNRSGDGGHADRIGFGGAGGNGGGIYNLGSLSLVRCTISENRTGNGVDGNLPGWSNFSTGGSPGGRGGSGGGLYNEGKARLTLTTVSGNQCGISGKGGSGATGASGRQGGSGGGVMSSGELMADSCSIVLNSAGDGSDAGNGWGIFGLQDIAAPPGGSGGNGGGMFLTEAAQTRLRNSVVGFNRGGDGGKGGIQQLFVVDVIFPTNTIPLDPFQIGKDGETGLGNDIFGVCKTDGFNLITDANGLSGITNGIHADHAGDSVSPLDPVLGPLQFNGGLTPTHLPLPASPLIDQGRRFGSSQDQRGVRRPFDDPFIPNAIGGDGTDIGACERNE